MREKLSREESQKFSECLQLLRARLQGWSGTNEDRAKRLEIPEHTVSELMRSNAEGLSLNQLEAIARRAGITPGVGRPNKVVGIPDIKPGKTIDVKDQGDRFSGTYYVDEVSHTF